MASLLADHALPLRPVNTVDVGVYVHIPFCHAKCHYCDFATAVGAESKIDSYLTALQNEMSTRGAELPSVSTLFIGGGTPTAISPAHIHRLFSALKTSFDFSSLSEATVEANPESSTEEVLRAYFDNGINRISFGLQASQASLLQGLGRLHSYGDFIAAYERARKIGFANINVDLMFGLPNQTRDDWKDTLEKVASLRPEHISAYALKVEPGTRLGKAQFHPDDDLEADLYLAASEFLQSHGYRHYEISNFSRPGREARHNLRYWFNQPTLGLGLSAASYVGGVRSKNSSQLSAYLAEWGTGRGGQADEVSLSDDERRKEDVMLQLRLDSGADLDEIHALNNGVFDQFLSLGLAEASHGRYRLTPRGWLLSNQLFSTLIS